MNGEGLDEQQLYDLAYNTIEPQLERIPGVASATVAGGKVREIEVKVQPDALRARGLAMLDVVERGQGLQPALPLRQPPHRPDRLQRLLQHLLRRGPAGARRGGPAGRPPPPPPRCGSPTWPGWRTAPPTRPRSSGSTGSGASSSACSSSRAPTPSRWSTRSARPSATCAASRPTSRLAIAFDQSSYIRAAIGSLRARGAPWAALLAVAVILIFLVSLSATGIIAVAIPLSIIATFVLLFFTGQTLNVFTLGGLALGVGRLVDDSIVELENIHRHLALGQDRRTAVLNAAQEVAMPIFVSTITTIVVFFPVVFLTGVRQEPLPPPGADHRLRAHHELPGVADGHPHPLPRVPQGRGGREGAPVEPLGRRPASTGSTRPTPGRCAGCCGAGWLVIAAIVAGCVGHGGGPLGPGRDRVLPRRRREPVLASPTRRPSAPGWSGPSW